MAWNLKDECMCVGDGEGSSQIIKFLKIGYDKPRQSIGTMRKLRSIQWVEYEKKYFAVGRTDTLASYSSGKGWEIVPVLSGTRPIQQDFVDIAVSNLQHSYVIVGWNILSTNKGSFEHNVTTLKKLGDAVINCVAYSEGLNCYVAIAKKKEGKNCVLISQSGQDDWQVISDTTIADSKFVWNKLAWGGGKAKKFVCIGKGNQVGVSSDGKTWQLKPVFPNEEASDLELHDVIWTDLLGAAFIAAGNNCKLLYSQDGENWRIYYSSTTSSGGDYLPADTNFWGIAVVKLSD